MPQRLAQLIVNSSRSRLTRQDVRMIEPGTVQATNHDLEPAGQFDVDRVVSEAAVGDYDALILSGGPVNPGTLRQDAGAVAFVRDFVTSRAIVTHFAAGAPVPS